MSPAAEIILAQLRLFEADLVQRFAQAKDFGVHEYPTLDPSHANAIINRLAERGFYLDSPEDRVARGENAARRREALGLAIQAASDKSEVVGLATQFLKFLSGALVLEECPPGACPEDPR